MLDLLFLIILNLLFFIIGFPLAKLLPKNIFKVRFFTACTFGYGITALLVTLLYVYGLSLNFIFKIFIVIILIIGGWIIFELIKKVRSFKSNGFVLNKSVIILLLFWLVGTAVLLGPKLSGGNQFAVFQGNQWDTFGYLDSGFVYSKMLYKDILNAEPKDFIDNPLLIHAKGNLFLRPSIHILYGFVGQIFPKNYHTLYYTFLIFFFSQVILIFSFIILNLFKSLSPLITGLFSLVFSLGFWGQYVLDINAWSHISSISINLLFLSLILFIISNYYKSEIGRLDFFKYTIVLFALFASSLYLYPENLFFHLPAFFIICLISFIFRVIKKYNFKALFVVFFGVVLGLMSGALFYAGTIHFLFGQVDAASGNLDMWRYFQAFFLGRDYLNPSFFDSAIDFFASISGLYFLTPMDGQEFFTAFIIRILLISGIIFLLYNIFLYCKSLFDIKNINKKVLIVSLSVILLVFAGVSWSYKIIYNVGCKKSGLPVSLTIDGIEQDKLYKIEVQRISPRNNVQFLEEKNGTWSCKDFYFKKIIIKVPNDYLPLMTGIDVSVGKNYKEYSASDFKKSWNYIGSQAGYVTFESSEEFGMPRSGVSMFAGIINWPGDKNIILNSFPLGDVFKVIILLIILFLFYRLYSVSMPMHKFDDDNKIMILHFSALFLLLFITDFGFLIKKDFWGAGKAFSFISPYFMLLLSIPIFAKKYKKLDRFILPFIIFGLFQVSFGVMRIYSSANNSGIHYDRPYPSAQWKDIKTEQDWNIDKLSKYLKKGDVVKLAVTNRWLENYLMIYLFENDIKFFSTNPVNAYFGSSQDLGFQSILKDFNYTITSTDGILSVDDKSKNVISINSMLKLKKHCNISAGYKKGWEPVEDGKWYRWTYMNGAKVVVFNSNDNKARVNLKLDYWPYNNRNGLLVYLNGKRLMYAPNNNVYKIKDIMLNSGENLFEFRSTLPPYLANNKTEKELNYAFSKITFEEL